MSQLLLTTTGTNTEVVLRDLGAPKFTHPVVDFDLLDEFDEDSLTLSGDLQNAVDQGWITLKVNGNLITDVSEASLASADSANVAFIPSGYTRDDANTEHLYDLGAHLKGIDNILAVALTTIDVQSSDTTSIQTSSTDWVDVPGDGVGGLLQIQTAVGKDRYYIVIAGGDFSVSKADKVIHLRLLIDGAVVSEVSPLGIEKTSNFNIRLGEFTVNPVAQNKLIKLQWKADAGSTLSADSAGLVIFGVG
jgi:hypothetical protein